MWLYFNCEVGYLTQKIMWPKTTRNCGSLQPWKLCRVYTKEIMATLGLVQRQLEILKEIIIIKDRCRCYIHRYSFHSVAIFQPWGGKRDSENLAAYGRKKIWRPWAANISSLWLTESCGLRPQETMPGLSAGLRWSAKLLPVFCCHSTIAYGLL